MENQTIENLYIQFEDIKEEVNQGKLPLFAQFDTETLLDVVRRIRAEYVIAHANEELIEELDVLINQLNQYLNDLQSLIESETHSI